MLASLFLLAAASATPIAQAPLRPFALLVAHCWVGNTADGKGTDRHCFDSVYGGQHVRDRHVVTVAGREVYAGETIYSARGAQVIFTYWNSIGGLGTGIALINSNEWRFTGTIHATASGKEQPMAVTWKVGADGYAVLDEGGKARPFRQAD